MIPRQWTGSNYTELFIGGENVNTTANIMKMFQNSFVVSGVVTVFTVFITSLAAFAYERLNFKGGNKIFWTLMYVSMFPNCLLYTSISCIKTHKLTVTMQNPCGKVIFQPFQVHS